MKLLFYFIAITTLCSCSFFTESRPEYVKIANKITNETGKKLKEQKNLHLAGTGGGMMHDIQMMMMAFQFNQIVDMETARELLVYSGEEYLHAINSNVEVKPYLHDVPFTSKNIEIVIYFHTQSYETVPSGEISIAAIEEGLIVYYIDDPERYTIQSIHEESYEDAVKIVGSLEKKNYGNK